MIVYINGNDNRCKQLAKLMIADGYQIQEDSRLISSCDIIYLKMVRGLNKLILKIML